jgi:ParB family transcriptional regulator, chromosome partitioning protein
VNKRKDALEALLAPARLPQASSTALERKPAATPGALKVMGIALQSLNSDAEEAEALRAQLTAGDRIIELDPAIVDRSPFQDRIAHEFDADFEKLKASVAESGQQVPVLVRPHPEREGRYQAAYGHRRLRAAQALGRPVKAIVRRLSDAELVIAQGRENLERRDLSYIERAQFAAALEAQGFDRATILAAVEPNKGNLSVMLSIAKAIPADIIAAIGPAPKVGRPRWSDLADALKANGVVEAARAAVDKDAFHAADTDMRFRLVFSAVTAAAQPAQASFHSRSILSEDGSAIGRIERSARSARVVFDDPAFVDFLADRLTGLHAEFRAAAESRNS